MSTPTLNVARVDARETVQVFAKVIGIPLDEWQGNCHAVSLAIVRSGVLKGPEGARVRVARGWCERIFSQHSWISLGDPYDTETRYVDPTLWCYTGREPAVWAGLAKNAPHHPHGGDGDIWSYGRPDDPIGPIIELTPETPLSTEAKDFLDLLGPLDRRGWSAIAHAPVLGWPAGEIFAAMYATEQVRALVPIDIIGMTTDLNPGNLYW